MPEIETMFTVPDEWVKVIRCRDCLHWYDRDGVCLKIYSDGNVSADAWQERKPYDYCSYGKRKENET